MSDMDVDEVKQQNTYNSLLKNKDKPKDSIIEESTSKSKRVVFQDKPVILNKTATKSSDGVSTKNDGNDGEKNREKKERVRPPTKVVVRRLPPTMTLEMFKDHVSPLPEHDYIYFVKADMSLGANAFSRAYINFVNISDLLTFYEQFDNYVFMDNKGNEYPAVVEFAPFQRVPKKRPGRKKDPKAGTLKDDPAYMAFVQSLREKKEAGTNKQTSAEHLLALTTDSSSKKEVTTPLLEFLKQRRAERQRIRDEKREERRRKDLERRRVKEEERRRRREGDSALRNPEPEDKEEGRRGSKERDRERDRPQSGLRKREDDRDRDRDRQRARDKDKKDGRPLPDNRQRDLKGRGEGGPKSYRDRDRDRDRDDRQKVGVQQRKSPEDQQQQRKKTDSSSGKKDDDKRKSYGETKRQGYNKPDYERRNNKSGYGGDRKYYGESADLRRRNKEKWELLGARPKGKEGVVDEEEDKKKTATSTEEAPGFVLKRRNSADTSEDKESAVTPAATSEPSKAEADPEPKADPTPAEVVPKRRNSLDTEVEKPEMKPRRQSSLDPEASMQDTPPLDAARKSVAVSKSQELERPVCSEVEPRRRSSLDSGDSSKPAREQEGGGADKEKDRGDSAGDSDLKRDPRAERRIRNKDRPSIEIYRPGMGRFSMQRKEREKGVGSSTERDSPSTSPSPTPSGRVSKASKSSQELRSMTFKRSVSREK